MTDTASTPEKRSPQSRRWVALVILLIPIGSLLWVTNWYKQRAELFEGANVKLAVPETMWLRLLGDEVAEVYFGDPVQLWFNNDNLTPRQLKMIGSYNRLKSLTLLGVSDNDLAHLSHLTNLEVLSISSSNLTGDGLRHLTNLQNLTNLRVQSQRLTDDSLQHLANLKALQQLRIESPILTDDGFRHLEVLSGLQRLEILGGSVSEKGMRSLTEISTLFDVTLHSVDFSGDPFRPLITRGNIRRLDLRRSTVTDDMVPSLAENDYLQEVYLIDTGVSTEARRKLDQAHPNRSADDPGESP